MLNREQAHKLSDAGLDYYNHNIDTSETYYEHVVSTRTFADRLQTLAHIRDAGISVCCGSIVGMGESETDRFDMLVTLASLEQHPESVPINLWTEIAGTPMAGNTRSIDSLDLVRTIATARIMMPTSVIRLSAGRHAMSEELQSLCFLGGANAVFLGDHLLTTPNSSLDSDRTLFEKLGLHPLAQPLLVPGRAVAI